MDFLSVFTHISSERILSLWYLKYQEKNWRIVLIYMYLQKAIKVSRTWLLLLFVAVLVLDMQCEHNIMNMNTSIVFVNSSPCLCVEEHNYCVTFYMCLVVINKAELIALWEQVLWYLFKLTDTYVLKSAGLSTTLFMHVFLQVPLLVQVLC